MKKVKGGRMEKADTQMDIDDCLVEDTRKKLQTYSFDPQVAPIIQDLVRIIDQLKKEKEELREAVLRNAQP